MATWHTEDLEAINVAHARGTSQLPTLPHLRSRRLWPVMAVVVAILGVG